MRCEQPGPVLLAAAALCCGPLVAVASPFEVPDVDPDEAIELKTTLERRSSGAEREWDAPQFELTLPAAPDVEVSLEAGYAITESDGETHSGLSDTEISGKWRFLHTERAKLTLNPAITFDTADDFGAPDHAFELGLLGSRAFGAFDINARIGYERSFDGAEDAVFGSVLVLHTLTQRLKIGAELAADHEDALHLRANLGVKWEVADHIEVQALLGRTIENQDGPAQTRAKLVVEYEFED
jgi:hypothetical protein